MPGTKTVKNFMVLVRCPTRGLTWANNSSQGPRCTVCGQTGHEQVRL